jgi:excisionase family DNA binding protein
MRHNIEAGPWTYAPGVMLTYGDVAAVFDVSKATVMRWVKQGRMKPPRYYGANARFEYADIELLKTNGLAGEGTHAPPVSMRARIGQLGPVAKAEAKRPKKRKGMPSVVVRKAGRKP